MSASRMKSKSIWDRLKETSHDDNGENRYPGKARGSRLTPDDFSGRGSREPFQGNINGQRDTEINRDRYRMPTDPAFEDDSWSQQQGGRIRGRVRSRSKSRDHRRSWSRGRSRYQSRSRSRSRSRIRSRSRDMERDRGLSRDDRYGSYEYTDTRNSSRISSQPCREFEAGNCRRGSQCRFAHQETQNSRGVDGADIDAAERWGSRAEYSSRYGGERSMVDRHRNKDSDVYKRDLLGDNRSKGNMDASGSHDLSRQTNRKSKGLCPFFVMGKCHRDDCKFSHDVPTSGGFNGRSHSDRSNNNSDVKNKTFNGSSWDDNAVNSHNMNEKTWDGPSWDEPIAPASSHLSSPKGRLGDDKNKQNSGPSWNDSSVSGFSAISKSNEKNANRANICWETESRKWDRTLWEESRSSDDMKAWDGPSWDDKDKQDFSDAAKLNMLVGKSKSSWDDSSGVAFSDIPVSTETQTDDRSRRSWENSSGKQDGIQWNEKAAESGYLSSQPPDVENDAANEYWNVGNGKTMLVALGSGPQVLDETLHTQKLNVPVEMAENSYVQKFEKHGRDDVVMMDDCDALRVDMVSQSASHQVVTLGKGFVNKTNKSPKKVGGSEQSSQIHTFNSSNGANVGVNGPVEEDLSRRHNTGGEQLHPLQVVESVVSNDQVNQHTDLLPSSTPISLNIQHPAACLKQNTGFGDSLPNSASPVFCSNPGAILYNPDARPNQQFDLTTDRGVLCSAGQESHMPIEKEKKIPESNKRELVKNPDVKEVVLEKQIPKHDILNQAIPDSQRKVDEGNTGQDGKAMRQFKVALVEFVKEVLKPTWKEGKLSREVHKTIVKKAVDKVTSTIQEVQIPRTQEKIDQYLAYSKSKITKLVEAYVERHSKG